MKIKMVTTSGEEHGLINTMSNHVPDTGLANLNPKIKGQVEKKRKDDSKIVKAKLISRRGLHERLDKAYCKYAGDPIDIYHLIPGYIYDLPMGFIEEVNSTMMPQREGLESVNGESVTDNGEPLKKDGSSLRLFELVPVSF